MNNALSFSIAISTFDRNDDLEKCLFALSKQTFKDFEILIVNGGKPEPVRNTLKMFTGLNIKIVDQERKGIVEARNLGWRRSSADIVCFIDDDLIVSPQWLENIRAAFLSDGKIAGVTGPTLIPEDRLNNRDFMYFLRESGASKNILIRIFAKLYKEIILENKIMNVGKILKSGAFTPGSNFKECLDLPGLIEVDYLEACQMCFKRSLLAELNGFDYIYEGTGEWNEPDFAFRVRKKGYRLVFNPKAVTYHHISQAGVFKARTNAYERSKNFVNFYFRNMKPFTLDKMFRFAINLSFINLYWCYKLIQTRNVDWLGGVYGTARALACNFFPQQGFSDRRFRNE
jgi:GT2 family glycosyltransferase